ncbi:MAG: hypothetical protein ACR2NZ_18230, partial [Rubripirellula sp.]
VVQPYLDRFDKEFHDPSGDGVLDSEWLANGAQEIQNRLPGNSTWNSGFGDGNTTTPAPIDPSKWTPQQAQQRPWNGLQR